MKKFLPLAILLVVLIAGHLACKKSDQAGLGSDNSTSANNASEKSAASKNSSTTSQSTAADNDQVLSDLMKVTRDYLEAIKVGDKATLERLLANDFNARWQGKVYDKDAWIGPQNGSQNTATDEIAKAELAGFSADSATLHFDRRITYKDGSAPYTERDSVAFVKKEGRWQIREYISGH